MRVLVLLLISILNISLQISLPNFLGLSILPNSCIVIVVCYSYLRTDVEGALLGLTIGLMQDILFSQVLGYYALIYFIVGYISSHMLKHFMNSNIIPIIILNFIATFMYSTMIYFFTYFFRGKLEFFYYMYNITLFEAIANAVISIPIFYIIYYIDDKLKTREQKTTKYYSSTAFNSNKR